MSRKDLPWLRTIRSRREESHSATALVGRMEVVQARAEAWPIQVEVLRLTERQNQEVDSWMAHLLHLLLRLER